MLAAETTVGLALLLQPGKITLVVSTTLGLVIRTMGTTDPRPFLPLKPQPAHVPLQRLGVFLVAARRVRVLDAQEKRGVGAARQQVIEQGRADIAEVQEARGAGGKAGLGGGGVHG